MEKACIEIGFHRGNDSSEYGFIDIASETTNDQLKHKQPSERVRALIKKDIEEIIHEERVMAVASERPIRAYWGTATTESPHFAYFVPAYKIADLISAGCDVTVLLADLHGYIANAESVPMEIVDARCQWYEIVIRTMLETIGVGNRCSFVRGSSFQLTSEYIRDIYRLSSAVTDESAKEAGTDVIQHGQDVYLSHMLYPVMQALDEQHLDVDLQIGDVNQRKIFMFAREHLPKIGYKSRQYIITPLMPGLGKSGKTTNDPMSKIDLLDDDAMIHKKISAAFSVDRLETDNVLLEITRVLFRYLSANGRKFRVRQRKSASLAEYSNYEELENDFIKGRVASADLKPVISALLVEFIGPIRGTLRKHMDVYNRAYRVNVPVVV